MSRRRSGAPDRGAVAVEFALLLPLLLLIIFGVIDFGRALNAQITLTQAAREGARLAALGDTNAEVTTRAQDAAVGVKPVTVSVTDQPNSSADCPSDPVVGNADCACPAGAAVGNEDAKVQVSYSFSFVTPVGAVMAIFGGGGFASPFTLSATGVMPCET